MPEASNKKAEKESENRAMQSEVRIVLRPYASALPMGCFAFATGNALYSAFLLHWIPNSETQTLAILLMGFVAPLELLPSVMAFLSRDTGAATAMGIFGVGWVVEGLGLLYRAPGAPSIAVGILLLALALILAAVTVVTLGGKPMLGIMLVAASLRSVCAALVNFGVHTFVDPATSVLGFAVAAIGFYAGLGLLLEDVRGILLPMTFRKNQARAALEGGLDHQVEHLHREAGVREQL